MIIGNKYLLIEKIGSGSFGSIYKGQNIRTAELVAIKVEANDCKKKILKNEAKIYQFLGIKHGFPQIKWFLVDSSNSYLVLDLLGVSLTEYKQNNIIPYNLVIEIAIQMIDRVEILHNNSLIHRDLKPDNFLFGNSSCNNTLYLIDFGFCRKYTDLQGNHIMNKPTKSLIGTPLFVSLFVHKNGQPSRRDDIESILFIILYLIDKLEWSYKKDLINDEIIKMKEDMIFSTYIPLNIINLIIYCRSLKFDECPDYEFIKNQLI
jgi:serine/threonine protein kinase